MENGTEEERKSEGRMSRSKRTRTMTEGAGERVRERGKRKMG
jgi:hypothetical protein